MALSFLPCILFPLFLTFAASNDPRMSESSAWPNVEMPPITEGDVEEAFKEAEINLAQRSELERQLVAEGRTINRKIRTSQSLHQLAAASPPEVSRKEERQRKFEEVTHILTRKFNLTSSQVEYGLPRVALSGPAAESEREYCTSQQSIQCDSSSPFRTADASCNNLQTPTWGMASTCNNRLPVSPAYSANSGLRVAADGGPLPNPRTLSLNVHSNLNRPTNYVDHMFMFYGQLLDHDITLTPISTTADNEAIECCPPSDNNHPQCAPITVSSTDPFYSQFNVTCINFVRSAICPFCQLGNRIQMNQVTPFIDCSFVYGNSENETLALRNNDGTGTLRTQQGDLLPPSQDPNNDQCSLVDQNQICFQAGDPRVNQHTTLTSLHTVYNREHNRIARRLALINPNWGEERLFQESRRILGAMMQCITYKEYLPTVLGSERMSYFKLWLSKSYTSYNPNCNPAMLMEFVTAGFRFGHSMVNSVVTRTPQRLLRDDFFAPFDLYNGSMSNFLREATINPAQQFDRWMVPDVTNFLYRVQGNNTGLDLASINIQRGRDHGMAGYTSYVYYCSMNEIIVRSFEDLVGYQLMTDATMNILRRNYRNVRDIDLFTGLLCEIYRPGAVIGPTATCIIGLQFQRLKNCDRFYFEHGGQTGSFTPNQLAELKKTTLSKLICSNTDISRMQVNAMLYADQYSNPVINCEDMDEVNLEAWRE